MEQANAGDRTAHDSSDRAWLFPRIWGAGLLVLIAATWRLWFSPGTPEFPLVPLLPLLGQGSVVGLWLSQIASIGLILSLGLVIASPIKCRSAWWLVAVSLAVSFLVDQHRLQPWAYQSSIYALVFASMDRVTARRWLIPLAASVYIYSSAGKFDYQFVHTVGQDFLGAATGIVGGIPGGVDDRLRFQLALVFPAVEFSVGIGLLFRRTRRAAALIVMAMHVGLLLILGPWNLDHSNGVLLWNLLLLSQAYVLLLREEPPMVASPSTAAVSGGFNGSAAVVRGVRLIVALAVLAPLLERRGLWDHWTSWSLYSPHTSHVDLEVHQSAIDRLSPILSKSLREDTNGDGWMLVDLGRWSLSSRGVPIYPQARYQLGLAAAIARRHNLTDEIRARWLGVSDRWSGERKTKMLGNLKEIEAFETEFWLLPAAPIDRKLQ